MSTKARAVIDSHRLMRKENESEHEVRVDLAHESIADRKNKDSKKWKLRASVHAGIFVVSFIFTTGFSVLSVLLWVTPGSYFSIVLIGLFSSLIFTSCFVGLRIFILHKFLNENINKEEDFGIKHHLSKSIVYSILALIVAIILSGFIISVAVADIM